MSVGVRPEVVRYGIDDISLGFDLSGSPSITRLNERPFVSTMRGRLLGEKMQKGPFMHLLGRSAAIWKPENHRLYVQAKLAPEGELVAPESLGSAVRRLYELMAVVGIEPYETPWCTRLDVAVDVSCEPSYGKAVLDGLATARLPNGWRVTEMGSPRSTVYFRPPVKDRVLARAYCRNLKTKHRVCESCGGRVMRLYEEGRSHRYREVCSLCSSSGPFRRAEPFALIRLEAQDTFTATQLSVDSVLQPQFAGLVWNGRYSKLAMEVRRLDRENQTLAFVGLVETGDLTFRQADRMNTFLDAERMGVAGRLYPPKELQRRRSEARALGLAVSEPGRESVFSSQLADLLAPFRSVWTGD
jgi:hypothetical protein